MSLAYYTMDDLRLGRGGFLQKGWTIRQRPELGEALAHYRGMPITKRKVLGLTDGFHVLELVKNVPLFPDDPGFIHTLKGLTQMVTPSFRVEVIQLLRDLYKVNWLSGLHQT